MICAYSTFFLSLEDLKIVGWYEFAWIKKGSGNDCVLYQDSTHWVFWSYPNTKTLYGRTLSWVKKLVGCHAIIESISDMSSRCLILSIWLYWGAWLFMRCIDSSEATIVVRWSHCCLAYVRYALWPACNRSKLPNVQTCHVISVQYFLSFSSWYLSCSSVSNDLLSLIFWRKVIIISLPYQCNHCIPNAWTSQRQFSEKYTHIHEKKRPSIKIRTL